MALSSLTGLSTVLWIMVWGVMVVASLAISLQPAATRTSRKAAWSLKGAGLAMLLAGIWPDHWLKVGSLSWLLATLLLALQGGNRLRQRRPFCAARALSDLGYLYSPVSGIWVCAFAWQVSIMGFDKTMTLLTGVHFAYVTLGAMQWGAQVGLRLPSSSAFLGLSALYALAPPLVAAGITLSHYSGAATWLEVAAVSLQVLATSGMSLLALARLRLHPLIRLSALLSLFPMVLALNYAWGRWLVMAHLDLAWMIPYHGLVNALGFVTLGLWGWQLQGQIPQSGSNEQVLNDAGGSRASSEAG